MQEPIDKVFVRGHGPVSEFHFTPEQRERYRGQILALGMELEDVHEWQLSPDMELPKAHELKALSLYAAGDSYPEVSQQMKDFPAEWSFYIAE